MILILYIIFMNAEKAFEHDCIGLFPRTWFWHAYIFSSTVWSSAQRMKECRLESLHACLGSSCTAGFQMCLPT